ncbi:cathepsin L-like [Ostrea edulis]|uniref:cathepsin L-like n=1 Tax=Ostrea edulis TaxID=37623 RepID=UPI0024AFB710|nr:cathepsin L-like [Ostrea edulis]
MSLLGRENNGCHGGLPSRAFEYIINNGGIDTEKSYPYLGKEKKPHTCQYQQDNVGATCQGFVSLPSGDEQKLQEAVASVGPVSVGIDARSNKFQLYREGVYYNSECSSVDLDHGVLVVGYGVYQGKDYWLVKNSWGTSWGLHGYIMMSRNQDNQCGIATLATYPTVAGFSFTRNLGVYSSARDLGAIYTFLILVFFPL